MNQHKIWITVLALVLYSGCGWTPRGKEYYLQKGRQFVEQHKYDDAALQYRKAIQKDSKYGEAYLRLGQLLLLQNRPPEAFNNFTVAVDLMPESDEAKVELGRTAISGYLGVPQHPQSLYQAAEKMASQLLAKNPNSFEGLRLMGYLAVADSHVKEAITYFQRALQIKPDQGEIATMLVQNLLADGQYAEAERQASTALATNKGYGPLYDVLYGYYLRSNRAADGEQLLKTKIANNPKQSFFVVQLADHYSSQKRAQDAQNVMRAFVANSNYPDARLEAGDFYKRIGKLEDALALYREGLQSSHDRQQEYRRRIVSVCLSLGRNQEAAQMVDAILKQDPDDFEALSSRAALRMATGDPAELRTATSEFLTLLQRKPNDNGVQYNLASAYRQQGRDQNARAALLEILGRDPGNRLALREMADLAIRARHSDEALLYAERLLALDPNNVGARLVRTSAWALRGLFDQVRTELRRLTQENPNLPEPWLQLATLDVQEKNYADAERIYQRLRQSLKGDVRPLRGLVNLYLAQKQPQKALALVRQEALDSASPQLRSLLVTAATQAGDGGLALSTAQKLASDFPNNPDYLVLLGQVYAQNRQADQAIASFKKAQQAGPNNSFLAASLGEALGQAGRYMEAAAAYRESLRLEPETPFIMNNLAWQLAMSGQNLDEALSMAERALRKEPNNTLFADTLGMVYLKSGKLDRALQTLQVIVRKEPESTAFRTHLAMAMLASGQRDSARAELEAALKLRPSGSESDEIQRLLVTSR